MTAFDSRNFWPLSSHVISGWVGLSAPGAAVLPFSGHSKAANFFSHSSPGFCAQATGLVTGAPLAVVVGACEAGGVEGVTGDGLVVARGAANGAGRGFCEAGLALFLLVGFFDGVADGDAFSDGLGDALGEAAGRPGCGEPATMRKRSWAVRLTESTRLEAFLPGISTMMLRSPEVETSDSETPLPLARASTMAAACLSFVGVTPFSTADSVIRVPPSRSSPRRGFQVCPSAASP